MKKVIFSLMTVMALGLFTSNTQAQTTPALKVGVFDIETIVTRMPEFKEVQKKMDLYDKDSLGSQRDAIEYQYNRADSSYRADSAAGKSKQVLNMINQQRQQYAWQLMNWQEIATRAHQQKLGLLARPLVEKVNKVFLEEVKAQKITLVLNPNVINYADDKVVISLFEPVAKKLGIDLKADPNAADSTGAGQ